MKKLFNGIKEVCGEVSDSMGFEESKGVRLMLLSILMHILAIIGIYTVNGIIVPLLNEAVIRIIFTTVFYIGMWILLRTSFKR